MKIMGDKYHPISCSFHDVIEDRIVREKVCLLTYICSEAGELQSFEGKLLDVVIESKQEFLVLENGNRVRLDHIMSLDNLDL